MYQHRNEAETKDMHFRGVEGWRMYPSDRVARAQFLEFSDVLADVLQYLGNLPQKMTQHFNGQVQW